MLKQTEPRWNYVWSRNLMIVQSDQEQIFNSSGSTKLLLFFYTNKQRDNISTSSAFAIKEVGKQDSIFPAARPEGGRKGPFSFYPHYVQTWRSWRRCPRRRTRSQPPTPGPGPACTLQPLQQLQVLSDLITRRYGTPRNSENKKVDLC